MAIVPSLGELERAVMEILWAARPAVLRVNGGSPSLTARDVQDALAERDLATTTVLTVLSRLERKGLVSRERDGRARSESGIDPMNRASTALRSGAPSRASRISSAT